MGYVVAFILGGWFMLLIYACLVINDREDGNGPQNKA